MKTGNRKLLLLVLLLPLLSWSGPWRSLWENAGQSALLSLNPLSKPSGLLKLAMGFQYMADDLTPSFINRSFVKEGPDTMTGSNTTFFPVQFSANLSDLLLLTSLNGNLKFYIAPDNALFPFSPQIIVGCSGLMSYIDIILDKSGAKNSIYMKKAPQFWGFSPYLILAAAVNSSLKLYTGYKFSRGNFSLVLTDTAGDALGRAELNGMIIDENYRSHELFFGVNLLHLKKYESAFLIGYNLSLHQAYAKLEAVKGHWTLGLGLYPDTFLKIWPYVRWHF